MGSISDEVEPAIYSVTIKGWRTATPVCLDRQHCAFHGTSPELGWQNSATRARPSPQPSHDGQDNGDQDAGNMPT
jgi:hypothetical protein